MAGIFQISLTAGYLGRPIQQHSCLGTSAGYNTLASPPCCYEAPSTTGDPMKSFHILWHPLLGEGERYNHISPLLPWKCGAMSKSCCIFGWGILASHKSRNEMAQCFQCSEWYHCACLGISLEEATNNTMSDCGCRLPQNFQIRDR